jgi:hypothetical protein
MIVAARDLASGQRHVADRRASLAVIATFSSCHWAVTPPVRRGNTSTSLGICTLVAFWAKAEYLVNQADHSARQDVGDGRRAGRGTSRAESTGLDAVILAPPLGVGVAALRLEPHADLVGVFGPLERTESARERDSLDADLVGRTLLGDLWGRGAAVNHGPQALGRLNHAGSNSIFLPSLAASAVSVSSSRSRSAISSSASVDSIARTASIRLARAAASS